ncbi:hypothetical protein BJ742DRAFT_737480 [Cladochytrium replicatum]|nr:hypothetical protein BJ742DRAFT_737480 [Cladochytrium replicatum]
MSFVEGKVAVLNASVPESTDLYRRPGKAFCNAITHTTESPKGAFTATVRTTIPALGKQYQHAGPVLIASPLAENDNWIKAGVEFWNGSPRASVVITRGENGSDWSVSTFGKDSADFWCRILRNAEGTVLVEISYDGKAWELLRKTYNWGTEPVQIGVMAAAPEPGTAFDVAFSEWSLVSGA